MLTRRRLLGTISGGFVVMPPLAWAQPGKIYRIGCVWAATRDTSGAYVRALHSALNDLGYGDRNLVIDHRFGDEPHRIPAYMDEFAQSRVDAILAVTNPVIAAAKHATTTVPIVMIYAWNPVGAGLIQSMARPGANVTGITLDVTPEIYGKHLELLRTALPGAIRVGVLRNGEFYRRPG